MNKSLFKQFMNENPTNTKDKYIFIVDSEEIAKSIILGGFKSVFLDKKDGEFFYSADTFIAYLHEITCMGKHLCDYVYISSCGTKRINDQLEGYFKSENLQNRQGWQLFKNKEYLASPDRNDDLQKTLEDYIERFEGNSKSSGGFGDFENLENIEKPIFPIDALPPVLKNYVLAVSESLQVSEDMVAAAVIGIVSTSVQGTFEVEPKADWREPLNLYLSIVSRPSERKTPLLKEVARPVYEYVAEENKKRNPEYNEYLIKRNILEKKVANLSIQASKSKNTQVSVDDVLEAQKKLLELEKVTLLRLVADDATPEALVKVMSENGEKIAIVTAEGGIFGMLAGRYNNNPNMDIFLKSYAGEPYQSDRIGRSGEILEKPLMTLLLMIQPKVLQDALENSEFRERGLMARFLYCLPPSKVGKRVYNSNPVNEEVRRAYDDLIKELLSVGNEWEIENKIIRFSPEAGNLSEEFFYEIENQLNDELAEIEDWAGKCHGQVMRIAGILHSVKHRLNSPNVNLEPQTMMEAIQIGKYFLEHAVLAFRISKASEPQEEKEAKYFIKKIINCIKSQNPQNPQNLSSVKVRDLYQVCKGRFSTRVEMQLGLDELVRRGFIKISKQRGSGRPSEIIEVNPLYWERWQK